MTMWWQVWYGRQLVGTYFLYMKRYGLGDKHVPLKRSIPFYLC